MIQSEKPGLQQALRHAIDLADEVIALTDEDQGRWVENFRTGTWAYWLHTPDLGRDEHGHPNFQAVNVDDEHIDLIKLRTRSYPPRHVFEYVVSFYEERRRIASRSGEQPGSHTTLREQREPGT